MAHEDDDFFYADPEEENYELAFFGADDGSDNDDITNDLPLNCNLQDNISGERSVPCQFDEEFDKVMSVHQVLYSMKDRFSC